MLLCFFRLQGNRLPGVFSTYGVRYNPNRCESNLLVLSFSDFSRRGMRHAPMLDMFPFVVVIVAKWRRCPLCRMRRGGFIVRRLR